MDANSALRLELVILFSIHFLLAGGIVSFGSVADLQVHKVFPKNTRWSWCPRFLHRGGLNLLIALAGLEAFIVPLIVIILFNVVGGSAKLQDRGFLFSRLLPFLTSVVSVAAAAVAGFGAAASNTRRFAYVCSYPILPFYMLIRPLSQLFLKLIVYVFPRLLKEIASPIMLMPDREEGSNGFIEENGSKLMHSIAEFGGKKVREAMVPRVDVFALNVHTLVDEALAKVAVAGHSRVPVHDGSMDRIVGILYAKDLLKVKPDERTGKDLEGLVREAFYVPEGKKIDNLLREFQREKKHIAIVIDEYGGTSGIITLEDILEEIVGEIRDEYDREKPLIRRIGANKYIAAGRVNLDELNDVLKTSFTTDEVDTLGGFLYNLIGRIPQEGEDIDFEGIRFRIKRLEGQRIADVQLRLPEKGKEAS